MGSYFQISRDNSRLVLIGSEGFNTGLELVLTKRCELGSGLVLTGIEYFKTKSKLDLNVQ